MLNIDKLSFDVDEILFNVLKLERYWIKRFDVPFYTLGRNAYLDGKTENYYKNLKHMNERLISNFSDVYVSIQEYLQESLGEPVYLNHNYSVPSFHIFESHPVFLDFPSNWHTDYPHLILDIGDKDAHSFTYVVDIPSCGAGLEYKDGEETKYLEYNVGDFIFHKGDFLHNIAPLKEYKPNEYRITLQGHIVRDQDRLIMFW